VLQSKQLHLHFPSTARKRSPMTRSAVWHWAPLSSAPESGATSIGLVDALTQAISCQPARAAVASLDSALHQGLITTEDLDGIFARVPARRRALRSLVDERAESGPESIVRLIALMLGFTVELQVHFPTVGRVDMVLDGWLVVECDSEEFHTGWDSQKKDRRRDLALAAMGMTCLRPIAEDIMYNPNVVVDALRGLRDRRRAWAGS
jgi:very-short-patch-repair endonuclease